MKKFKFYLAALPFLFCNTTFAQVQVDHSIQLTGSGSNARVSGIHAVVDSADAASAAAIQNGNLIYATATGSSNNFNITISPPIAGYQKGMVFNFISNQSISGAATLNVNSLGTKPITKNINQSIGQCDIQNGQFVTVAYDGANFQMTSVSVPAVPTTANAGPNQVVNDTSTSLAANTPTTGTGLWTIVSGSGGSLNNAGSPTSTFKGIAGNTYILNWTIAVCGSSSSSADTITFQFSPTDLSGLLIWYDANDASTFTYSSGSLVNIWADKSGHNNSGSNSNTSEQPAVVANDINGLPAVRFASSTDAYLENAAFTMNIANRSVFVVIKENDANWVNSRWVSITGSGYDWNSNNGYEIGNGPNGTVVANNNSSAYAITATTSNSGMGIGYEAPLGIYTDIANGGSGTLYVNGVAGGTANNPNASTSPGGIVIGGGVDGLSQMGQLDGDIAEVIVYGIALTPAQRDEVGAYLSGKWGIPFTP